MKKFVLATAVFLMSVPVAEIAMAEGSEAERDQIVINIKKEDWVTTNTANVGVNFDIVQQKETALELKLQVIESLDKLSKETAWHITSSRENKDRTGLNRWHVTAEARVPEKSVAGLQDRAEKVSRPGFNLRIGHVDFSPSLAEIEKIRSELRAEIYKEASEEAKRLTAAIQGRKYRVFVVDFGSNGRYPRPVPMRAMAAQSKEMVLSSDAGSGQGNGAAELAVSRKQVMSAAIILTSDPIKAP